MPLQLNSRPIDSANSNLLRHEMGVTFPPDSKSGMQKFLPLGAMLAGFTLAAQDVAAQTGAPAGETTLSTVNVQAGADKPDGMRATATRAGKTLQDPAVRSQLAAQTQLASAPVSLAEAARYFEVETARYRAIAQQINLQPQ